MEFVFCNIHHTVVAYNYIYQGPFFIHLNLTYPLCASWHIRPSQRPSTYLD